MGALQRAIVSPQYGQSDVDLSSASQELDDLVLLKRMARRDETALDILYTRHAPALLGYLLNLVGDRFEAEEILQDTFVAAWKFAGRFQGRSRVRTWLFSIAHRQARDRHRRHSLAIDSDFDSSDAADPAPGPEDYVLAQAETTELAALVSQLRPLQREVLVLAFAYELSYAEIALVLDVPVGTVKSRLNSAKRALQALAQGREEKDR